MGDKMKRTNLIFWAVIIMISIVSSLAYAKNYVCIDPGHGGTQSGAVGRIYGVLEKDVNLGVGAWAYTYFGIYGWDPIMTREADTTLSLQVRADRANKANNGAGVDAFVSIHHNAPGDTTDTLTNGTETFWCNADSTDSHWVRRDTTDTLATKVYFKLRDWFHYPERGVKLGCYGRYWILKLTKMGSTISEASFLTCAEVERNFYFYFSSECQKEAEPIFRGTVSYLRHAGITTVKNSYSGGNSGSLIVSKWDWFSDICFETDTVASPYTTCWLGGMFGEAYCLQAITPQWMGGYQRTFHHWAHLDHWGNPDDFCYEPLWKFEVPYFEYDYHNYVAYFSGGPYSAEVVSPNGWETWYVAEQETIKWNASIGADSTTLVNIYLDRNSGNDGYPEHLAGSLWLEWGNSFPWTVTGPVSAHCKIKIVAEDVAGNSDWDVSNYDFSISGTGNNNPVIEGRLHCRDPQEECNECIKWGESVTLEIFAHDPDADSIYYEWYAEGGPLDGHFPNGQNRMTTAQNWVVYTAPTKAGEGGNTSWQVFLSVTVIDVRGGSDDTSSYLGIYDLGTNCLCGDVQDDEIINSGDIVFLTTYLYKRGSAPYPYEKADVNNDCVVNSADITYLNNYLFKYGPLPECCWIHPISKLVEFP
jgi:N-acetylmuramoyl-L-alanine amidase